MNEDVNMINQLRADTYRLIHSVGFYVTLGLVIVYSALITKTKTVGGIMANGNEESLDRLARSNWTILNGIRGLTISASLLMYMVIGLFIITIGYEFSQQTYKNTLISGISRSSFILSKYITLLITIFISITAYFLTTIIMSLILGRSLGASLPNLLSTSVLTDITITFFISIVFSMGILILVVTNSIVISSIFIVVFPIGVTTVRMLANWKWLKYIDFFGASNEVSLGNLSISEFEPYIATCGVLLGVCIVLSLVSMREKEL